MAIVVVVVILLVLITQAAAPFDCSSLFRLLHFVIDFVVTDMHLGLDIVGG